MLHAYILAWIALLRTIDYRLPVEGPPAAAVVIALGAAFDWFEERNFTLAAVTLLSVAYAASRSRTNSLLSVGARPPTRDDPAAGGPETKLG